MPDIDAIRSRFSSLSRRGADGRPLVFLDGPGGSQVPDVVIELIDRPDEKPWGSGEPSASVVPSAVSNAVFNATGARLRSVPFTFDKVKAALSRV